MSDPTDLPSADHPYGGAPSDEPIGRARWTLAGLCLIGASVSVGLGVISRVHEGYGVAPFTLGFPSLLQMKLWLGSAAAALGIVQLATALRMYGRLGGTPEGVRWMVRFHRTGGVAAVLISLPVAFACLWAFGFGTWTPRVLVHSLAGCVLYGAFVTKMLALRARHVPAWAVPVLGGLVLTAFVVAWSTSVLWWMLRD